MCPCMGPKGPGLIKKYPAVAGYLMKMEQSSTKRDLKREVGFAKRMDHVAGKRWT
jgi:hypothetical protein